MRLISPILPPTIYLAFNTAIFPVILEAIRYFEYFSDVDKLLKQYSDPSGFIINSNDPSATNFLMDCHLAFQNTMALSLMKLFDDHKKSYSLRFFLKSLQSAIKESPSDTSDLIMSLEEDINIIKTKNFKKIVEKLTFVRNAKYAHIDRKNAMGQLQPKQPMDVSPEEIAYLIDFIKKIISNYEDLLGVKINNHFNSDSHKEILKILESYCFNATQHLNV